MKISVQEGKRYVLANGEFVGPMFEYKVSGHYYSLGDVKKRLWRPDGKRYYNCFPSGNIVEELEEPPITKEDSMSEPKQWQHMSPEEKGALLLAHHEGKVIEVLSKGIWTKLLNPRWTAETYYRVKPEPVVKTVTLYGEGGVGWAFAEWEDEDHTACITFQTKDGKPDWSTLKGEDL